MSQKNTDQLYELIQCLTSAEKRYFKIYSERQSTGQTKYLKLFDLVERETGNDEQIKFKLRGEPLANYLPIAKNRLFNHILASLDLYHSSRTAENQIERRLHSARILLGKGLYKQSYRQLGSAEKLAEKHQLWAQILEILRIRKRLIELSNYQHFSEKELTQLRKRESGVLRNLETEGTMWEFKSRIFKGIFSEKSTSTKLDFENFLKFCRDHRDQIHQSFESTFLFYHVQSAFHLFEGDAETAAEFLTRNLAHLENSFHFAEESPGTYISVVSNLLYIFLKLNDPKNYAVHQEKLKSLPARLKGRLTEPDEFKVFNSRYSLDLEYALINGDRDRALFLTEVLPTLLHRWEPSLPTLRMSYFLHGISVLYILLENPSKALVWNNKVLSLVTPETHEDPFIYGLLVHGIIQIELGNIQALSPLVKSLNRYLESLKRSSKLEHQMVKFFKKICANPESKISLARALNFELTKSEFTKCIDEALAYFDFKAWAESLFTDYSMCEIVKRNRTSD